MIQFLRQKLEAVVPQIKKEQVSVVWGPRSTQFEIQIYAKYLKNKVITAMNNFPGKKVLVMDQTVAKMIEMVIDSTKVMTENGVDGMLYLDSDELDVHVNQIIFFVLPERENMKRIVRIIRNDQLQHINNKYMLLFCPRNNVICKDYLQKEAVLGNLIIRNFNFDLIPLAADLLSLQQNHAFKQLVVKNDMSSLAIIAESIQRMQLIHGKFANIHAKGSLSMGVLDIIKQQTVALEDEATQSKFHTLFIVDRQVDMITPMLTPFTYESLLDEYFGIKQNQVDLSLIGEKRLIKLTDPIFQQIKIMNIKQAATILEQKRKFNKSILSTKDQQRTTEEKVQYFEQVKVIQREHNFVMDHYALTNYIVSQIEEIIFNVRMTQEMNIILQNKQQTVDQTLETLIQMEQPFNVIMRLMILYCQIYNGMKPKLYDQLRREIIHVYGLDQLLLMQKCEKLSLIGVKIREYNVWERIQRPLRLINEDIDYDTPSDFSYVYLAYAPIIVRLFEELIVNGNWNGISQSLKDIPGDSSSQIGQSDANTYVIYFIGGVNYAEIAALRWLSLRYRKEVVICTTHICNGNDILTSLQES